MQSMRQYFPPLIRLISEPTHEEATTMKKLFLLLTLMLTLALPALAEPMVTTSFQ